VIVHPAVARQQKVIPDFAHRVRAELCEIDLELDRSLWRSCRPPAPIGCWLYSPRC